MLQSATAPFSMTKLGCIQQTSPLLLAILVRRNQCDRINMSNCSKGGNKLNTNMLASLAVSEISDEMAAICSGGCITTLPIIVNPAVTLFANSFPQGRSHKIAHDTPHLGCFDNVTSSVVIHRGRWELFSEPNYRGKRFVLGPGRYVIARLMSLSSLRRIR
jgi:hypothetical protein